MWWLRNRRIFKRRGGTRHVNLLKVTTSFHGPACCRVLVIALLLSLCLPLSARTAESKLVRPGKSGRLIYLPDEKGNTIPDFSYCGFGAGGVRLPRVAVKRTVRPGEGDDGARIQQAIDT